MIGWPYEQGVCFQPTGLKGVMPVLHRLPFLGVIGMNNAMIEQAIAAAKSSPLAPDRRQFLLTNRGFFRLMTRWQEQQRVLSV